MTKDDAQKLQGTWRYESLEVEGKPSPADVLQVSFLKIQGQKFAMSSMGIVYEGQFTVDEGSQPHTIDIHFTAGPEKGKKSLGIYTLDGDKWRICLGLAGRKRPRDFKTTPGSGHALELLRRETNADRAETPPAPKASTRPRETGKAPLVLDAGMQALQGEWTMVSGVRDGQKLPVEMVRSARRVVTGDRTVVTFGGATFLDAKFRVDAVQSPKPIDYVIASGVHDGKKQLGIYEFEKDKLRLCFAEPGRPRPADFATSAGDGRTLTIWKKSKE